MDQEVSRYSENDRTDLRNGNLGFVFQSFNLIDELTVFENVELPLLYAGVSTRERVKLTSTFSLLAPFFEVINTTPKAAFAP